MSVHDNKTQVLMKMKSEKEQSDSAEINQPNKQKVPKTRVKVKNTISSAKRNASCSHGWLRLLVQCIFGAITIVSFIMIVYMSMSTKKDGGSSRCRLYSCRVVCVNVPFFESHLNDLIYAVKEVELNCSQISVTLHEPYFVNSTIPSYWLSGFNSNVRQLEIIGGDFKRIAPNAFMTRFGANIRTLQFEGMAITDWTTESFIGLINLESLYITNCYILAVNRKVLNAVDDTLQILSITDSGYWSPNNFTGQTNMSALKDVFLSNNNFNNIINRRTFSGLRRCKTLFLNSCRISSIELGAFDYLHEIEALFLNDNLLVVVTHDLFSHILAINSHQPRINLANNPWYCDCVISPVINTLISSGALLVEPICHYPVAVRGQSFSEFFGQCSYNNSDRVFENSNNTVIDAILFDNGGKTNQGISIMVTSTSILSCTFSQQVDFHSAFIDKQALFDNTNFKPNSNDLLKIRFAIQSDSISMLEITTPGSSFNDKYGLLWYQTTNPADLYCVNRLPNFLRVYNVETNVEYTFCPINLDDGSLDPEKCVFNSLISFTEPNIAKTLRIIAYFLSTIIFTILGASIVYTVIRKFPHLLKGSDRILFVKHKNVDALVLPPKVPTRDNLQQYNAIDNNIFTLTDTKIMPNYFVRNKSTRSNAPSYISAMQPTEEQLTEWRLRQHFDNNVTITSAGFNVPYLLLNDDESMYCSLDQTSRNNHESIQVNTT